MSNQAKEVTRLLGRELEKFEADNICLRRVEVNRMGGVKSFRNEFTEWMDAPYISTTVDGLTISQFNEITGMAIPHRVNRYISVPFKLTNTDTLDGGELQRKVRSGFQAIDAAINRGMCEAIQVEGSQYVSSTAALDGFQNVADVETRLIQEDVSQTTEKTLALNAADYNRMAKDLQIASRSINTGSISENAYEKAKIAEIASFLTFKTSFTPTQAAAGGGGAITVTGAQSFVPTGRTLDSRGNPTNVDNRVMNLIVSATASVVPGDKLTIAGVNAVSLINKNDTGNLRTFTVVEVVDGTNLTISPPIIPVTAAPTTTATQAQADYANCTVEAAGGAAIVFINFDQAQTNIFWENDSVAINSAPFVGSEEDLGGLILMNETTEMGLSVVVAKQGAISDLSTEWRISTFVGFTVRDPLKCGTLAGSQTP